MRSSIVRLLVGAALAVGSLSLVSLIPSSPTEAQAQEKAKSKKKKSSKPKAQISKAPPDVTNEIVGALTAYTKALSAHDAKAAGELYTDDITIWGSRRLKGRAAVDAWLKDFTSNKVVTMTLRDMLIRTLSGDSVTVLGIWDSHVEWDEKGAPKSVDARDGSFLYVMSKQGGKWKVQTALVARKPTPAAVAATTTPADQPKVTDTSDDDDDDEEGPSTADDKKKPDEKKSDAAKPAAGDKGDKGDKADKAAAADKPSDPSASVPKSDATGDTNVSRKAGVKIPPKKK